jgi:excisionase family DNA binding protein
MKLWLNVAEGAEYAGVCRDLVYDACAARRMHHIRVGGRRAIRLKREWIDAWLERHAVSVTRSARTWRCRAHRCEGCRSSSDIRASR